jgi:heme oxygenase
VTAYADLRPETFDARASLRDATHATHMRLHGLPQFRAIERGRLSRADYAALLGSLHAYHSAIAAAAEKGGLDTLSSSPERRAMLAVDLAALGASPAAGGPVWAASSREALYGALYVAEGSALGGKVIARQLDYLFGDSAAGRSFFRGDGATGPRWRAFLTRLERDCDDPATLTDLVAGAEASFALFERCIAS